MLRCSASELFPGIVSPRRIKEAITLGLSANGEPLVPGILDLRAGTIALAAYHRKFGSSATRRLCFIHAGHGLGVLPAVEMLAPAMVGLIDRHESRVASAVNIILRNLRPETEITLLGGAGILPRSLSQLNSVFDVIFFAAVPGLPIVPTPRRGRHNDPFAVHVLSLIAVRRFLSDAGRIVCSVSGCSSLPSLLRMMRAAGYCPEALAYTWETVSDDVVRQKAIHGAGVEFYPADRLSAAFASLSSTEAVGHAAELEAALRLHAVSAAKAVEQRSGGSFGRTVLVLAGSAAS